MTTLNLTTSKHSVPSLQDEDVQLAIAVLLCKQYRDQAFQDLVYSLKHLSHANKKDAYIRVSTSWMYKTDRPWENPSVAKSLKLLTSGGMYYILAAIMTSLNNTGYSGQAYHQTFLPLLAMFGRAYRTHRTFLLLAKTPEAQANIKSLEAKRSMYKALKALGNDAASLVRGSGAFFLGRSSLREVADNELSVLQYLHSLPTLPTKSKQRLAHKLAKLTVEQANKPKAPVLFFQKRA